MPEDAICKRSMYISAEEYRNDPTKEAWNEYDRPLLDIFNVCDEIDMLDMCLRMVSNGCHLSKSEWKNMIYSADI